MDLILRNGYIIDGSGKEKFEGDIAVKQGKIIAIGSPGEITGEVAYEIDVGGNVVSPGFIDIHSHSDWILPRRDHDKILRPLVEQGITTVVAGNCGYSPAPIIPETEHMDILQEDTAFLCEDPLDFDWDSMSSFFQHLNKQGLLMNVGMLTGHGTLRYSILGKDMSYPETEKMEEFKETIIQSFADGSFGISFGLGYEPGLFVSEKELIEVASIAGQYNRIVTVHPKALSRVSGAYPLWPPGRDHILQAMKEIIALTRKTNVKMHISHLLFVGEKSWNSGFKALQLIDEARRGGLDITFDTFPYFFGNTTIYVVFPAWFRKDIDTKFSNPWARWRLWLEIEVMTRMLGFNLNDIQLLWGGHPDLERFNGMFFDKIGEQTGKTTFSAYLMVSEKSRGKALCLMHKYSGKDDYQDLYETILTHPANMFATDTILTTRGRQNPAGFGALPRVLQLYWRERKLLSLEDAIARMTGKSAKRIGLKDRGILKEGNWADITVFDQEDVRDNTTLERLEEKSSGIKHVFINGVQVVKDGVVKNEVLPGQVLKS